MKKLIALCALVALTGFGCAKKADPTASPNTQNYHNSQYGFSLMFPAGDEIRVREDDIRADKYLGKDVDFFASVRDISRPGETSAANVAYAYAAKGLSVADFKQALEESGQDIAVKSTESVKVNGVKLTKMVNTTPLGIDKVHYLLERNGTLVIFSVFIGEDKAFDAILQSVKVD